LNIISLTEIVGFFAVMSCKIFDLKINILCFMAGEDEETTTTLPLMERE